VAHGPAPRDYRQRTPKKMVRLALRSALSDRAAGGKVVVIDDWAMSVPKTKEAKKALAALGLSEGRDRALIVLRTEDEATWKSFRNLSDRVQIIVVGELNAYDVLVNDWIVFTSATLDFVRAKAASAPIPLPAPEAAAPEAAATEAAATEAAATRRRHPRRPANEGPRDVILRPVISEKSYALLDKNVYTFVVAPHVNKIEIRQAVESIFGVRVTNVNTLNRKGKRKRNRRTGTFGTRPSTKRAVVSLAEGDRIELFER